MQKSYLKCKSCLEKKPFEAAKGVWGGRFEKAFFDVRVFNPCAKSNPGTLPSVYRKHELKRRDAMSNVSEKLNKVHSHVSFFRAREVWAILLPCFTCFPCFGDQSEKIETSSYSQVLLWIRCFLGLAILRSSIICIRGSHSSYRRPHRWTSVNLHGCFYYDIF